MSNQSVALKIHKVNRVMTSLSIKTIYVCERCSKPVHISMSLHPTIQMDNDADFEAVAKIEECDSCTAERMELIRDLYNALPWEKQRQFDSPILDELEQMIRGRQTVGYRGVTL